MGTLTPAKPWKAKSHSLSEMETDPMPTEESE